MKKTTWALVDNRAGSVGQLKGIIQAMDDSYEIVEKKLVYTSLAKLPNMLLGKSRFGLNLKESAPLEAPWPDLVLSISRRTMPIARWIKKKSGGKSKIVQLMYPGKTGLKDLDLVIVPQHDYKPRSGQRSKNIFYITGCPHRVSLKAMEEARAQWAPAFEHLPQPLTAVIIGGAIKNRPFSLENATALAEEIHRFKQLIGGSILITTSRRTGHEAEKLIRKKLKDIPAYTYWWGEKKENPIMGFWACAEQIIVTGDSVSMTCESCGSGKPVLVFSGKDWLSSKHERLLKTLYDGAYATALEDKHATEFVPAQRLDPSLLIAEKIAELF